ncbi:hypothetical protein AAVH_13466 [Aphelenchoides avenae]|nr:hypothetical protein AAVH_13466 [Aphelenchus avenae]
MMQNIGKAVENVRRALEKKRERARKHYDERNKVNPWKYKPGQRVMVLDPGIGNGVAQKLAWRFFDPFRISEILNNNAKVYPLDKPHADPQLVPLDRLCPIPAEVPNISYSRRPDRSRIISSCILAGGSLCQLVSEIDDALELSPQAVEITDRIVLREAKVGRDASVYESDEKKVVLVALLDDSGLGPYSVCSGNCTSRCKTIHVSDVLPSYTGTEAKLAVPTLAHQVFLVELGKYLDEAELPAKITVLLGKSADLLNREFTDLVGGRPVSAPANELIQAQAYLRKAHCHRVQMSLAHNTSTPIRVFGDNHDDHAAFTRAVYSSGTVSHPCIDADVLGPIWERVRNGSGRNVVSGPFLALCPPGDEPMFRSDLVRIRTVSDLREAIYFLRTNILDGTVQAVAVSLPPPSKECQRRLDELLNLLDEAAFKHLEVHIVPPPASVFTSYKDIVDRLLEEPRPQIVHGAAYGRSFLEIGRLGSGLDRRIVRDGRWTACGMDAARSFLVDISGLEWLRRPPQPPRQQFQQNRLRSAVHVPTQVGMDNIQLTGPRNFQNRQPAAVNRAAPAASGTSNQRFRPYERDQGTGFQGFRRRDGQFGGGR